MMSDENGRDIWCGDGKIVNGLEQLLARRDVEPCRGLVKQQQPGIRDESARNERSAPFALRQRGPQGVLSSSEAYLVDQFVCSAGLCG
ncbi:hypothetical protein GCM10027267_28430 [Paramicrobacterium agarici]